MTSHNQLAKDLLQNFFGDFVRLAAPDEAVRLDLEHTVFVDKQMFTDWPAGERRELDLLAEAPVLGGDQGNVLIHVEIEAEASGGMAERLWKYYMQVRLMQSGERAPPGTRPTACSRSWRLICVQPGVAARKLGRDLSTIDRAGR